jgi:transposase
MIRLSDEHWERIRDHFPEEHIPDGRPGRKSVPTRRVLEAVLWILNTGAQWHMLPQSYPNYKTVHRRFQSWCPCCNSSFDQIQTRNPRRGSRFQDCSFHGIGRLVGMFLVVESTGHEHYRTGHIAAAPVRQDGRAGGTGVGRRARRRAAPRRDRELARGLRGKP